MRNFWINWIAAFFALLAVTSVASANPVTREFTTVELVSAAKTVTPGQNLRIGLFLSPRDGWHTYWRNPGDSGLPPGIDWTLPEGVRVSDIHWPGPEAIPYGPLMNFGYKGPVTLLMDLALSENLPRGQKLELKANAQWLVCSDICVPEEAELVLPLMVAERAEEDPRGAELIAASEYRLPRADEGEVVAEVAGDAITLRLTGVREGAEIRYFPNTENLIENAADQTVLHADGVTTLTIKRRAGAEITDFDGVLRVGSRIDPRFYELRPRLEVTAAATAASRTGSSGPSGFSGLSGLSGFGLGQALLFAFIGGLILNLMPCVFPILSLKAVAIAAKADREPAEVRQEALVFTLGVLVSFAVLAGLLIAVRAAGEAVGWGFQLQSPWIVQLLAYVLFAVGLNLSGVYAFGSRFAGVGQALTEKPGPSGAFFTGVLAVVVATPCTAPFMATAIGFALTQSAVMALVVFLALGLGLAAPFLIFAFWPGLQRRLPKPGPWMETFRQVLAFPMYASAAWLVWVLAQQVGPMGVAYGLAGLLLVAFAAWCYGRERRGPVLKALMIAAVIGSIWLLALPQASTPVTPMGEETWSEERVQALRAEGRPVFVNFTAAWCITCLANERIALSGDAFRGALEENGVTYLKADWTNRDPEITRALQSFGRSGVPLYVVYPAGAGGGEGAEPQVLPQLLTEGIVVDALRAAGAPL